MTNSRVARGARSLVHFPQASFERALGAALGAIALLAGAASAQALPQEHCLQMQYKPLAQLAGSAVSDIAAADIDGDADVDVLLADGSAGLVRVLLNRGGAGFAPQAFSVGVAPRALGLADLDGDGDADLAIGFAAGMRWLRNDGAGGFAPVASYAFPLNDANPIGLGIADFDEDGHLDVALGLSSHALASGGSTGGLWVALGDGAGGFQPQPTHELALRAFEIALADFDGDGHLDVAELGGNVTASTVSIASGLGDGSFVNALPSFSAGIYAGGLAAGDFDGDGDADLATGFKYSASVRLNDGHGQFALAQSLAVGSYVKGIASGDLDLDGDLDLLVTSGSAAAIRIAFNDGLAHFALAGGAPASIQCYSVLLADTSGDGYPDAWAGDVSTGGLYTAVSACAVARYGQGKLDSLGVAPAMDATGSPALSGSGLSALGTQLIPQQPALFSVGFGPLAQPLLGGQWLVQAPWFLFAAHTSAGSGDPSLSDGTVELPVSTAQLAALGLGTRVFVQVLALDPLQPDGTQVSLSDGLWFEVRP